ncbi:flavodoxin [Neptunicella sp. SCSIO 80796]|uniref:flavodoxin n=1 Tax=Neptunicella plasticusilytica TaxID=3117012 RepID=UPI003A4DFC43
MPAISIFVGSVYGGATFVAEQVAEMLEGQGFKVQLCDPPSMDAFKAAEAILIISSTTGQGDIPPDFEEFYYQLQSEFPLLNGKPFGVIGLGDSSYGETYCGAGRKLFALLEELQGQAVMPLLKIDACETLEPENEALPWAKEWAAKL